MKTDNEDQTRAFELRSFLPYRLAVLADIVSQSLAQLYRERFALNRAEWRILAALGDRSNMTGKELADYTTLDKMQVSRAVNAMLSRKLLVRSESPTDRRNMVLCLSPEGKKLLDQVIPLVKAREEFLIDTLSQEEQKKLLDAMDEIENQARLLLSENEKPL